MSDDLVGGIVCNGCGETCAHAPGIGYYCRNKGCAYEHNRAKAMLWHMRPVEPRDARIQALEAALAEVGKELADTKLRLSHMATMYSDAVDIFGTGFSGYDAVLRGQAQRRIFRETGLMPKKADVMPEHERRPDHHEWAAEKSAIQFSLAEAEGRVKAITIAMHDAIRRPIGVVPASAEPFYSPAMADQAEARRVTRAQGS